MRVIALLLVSVVLVLGIIYTAVAVLVRIIVF